jgi:hypothetical protein
MGFIRFLLRNLGLKILGLILALLLWFHVATNRDYDIELAYTFEYLNLPEELVMTAEPPEEVNVRLRASGKQLLRLWWSDRHWPIDLSGASAGEFAVTLWADDVPRFGIDDVEVVELAEPGNATLWLDSLATRTVPVRTDEAFLIASGYVRFGPTVLSPDSVRLGGPWSLLTDIRALTLEPIGKDEWDESIDEMVPVQLPPVYNLSCFPEEVHVTQVIEPFATREYDSLPVTIAASGSDVTCTVDPPWVSVEIGGPESRMGNLTGDSVRVVYVAARDDTSGARCALWVDVPPPFQVLGVRPDSITVHHDELSRTDSGN